jgi:predicted small metal-binding protein
MTLRAMLRYCRYHLEAQDEERLRKVLEEHLRREHSALGFDEERIREIVAAHAYDLEYVEVPGDEELIPEPY